VVGVKHRDAAGARPELRSGGRSPETITITSATLHLVYSSQQVNPFYNRAAVWLGQCRTVEDERWGRRF
jgi:hypothetical protein